MKKLLGSTFLAAIMLVGMSSVASAAPATCSNQQVTVGFSCSLGGLEFDFTNLSFVVSQPGDALALDASKTTVSGNDVILGFQILAGAGLPVDIELGYNVVSGSANMVGIDASYALGQTGSISETAVNTTTQGFLSSIFDPKNNGGVVVNGTPATFVGVSNMSISKDITASTFSDFTDSVQISGVPEPMTLSMMGVGLLGLGLISRRRKQS